MQIGQTNQIMQIAQTNQNEMKRRPCTGHERGRSCAAGFVMKTFCSIAALVAVQFVGAIESRIAVPRLLPNGDLSISYNGFGAHKYALERAGSLARESLESSACAGLMRTIRSIKSMTARKRFSQTLLNH